MEAHDAMRLQAEADYAFRQAFALCPTHTAVVFRYLNFLMAQGEIEDAILLVSTARKLDPNNQLLESVLERVRDSRVQTQVSK